MQELNRCELPEARESTKNLIGRTVTFTRMSIDIRSPRMAIALGTLALIPAALYGFERAFDAGMLSIVNILIVLGVLVVLTRPISLSGHDDVA